MSRHPKDTGVVQQVLENFTPLAVAIRMTLNNRQSMFYTGKLRIYIRPHLRTFAHDIVRED